ncbi:hypothetical protein MRB53_038704 [Persea americana]|nr:hypothetical protein MRB53_038704 [Persea americana]
MRLPVELHLEIASYLEFPENIYLNQTSAYFRYTIPSLKNAAVREAAELSPFARRNKLAACQDCRRLRRIRHFAMWRRTNKRTSTMASINSYITKHELFCLDCGRDPTVRSAGEGDSARSNEPRYHGRFPAYVATTDGPYLTCLRCRRWGKSSMALLDETVWMCNECFGGTGQR